jgi:hypothetical protein
MNKGLEFDSGSVAVYGKWLLYKTMKCLPDKLSLPESIPTLVESVYGECDSNLLTDEEKKAMTVKSLPKAKEQPSKPYDFGLPDFDSAPVKNLAGDDLALPKDDPFADIDFDAILNGTSSGKDDPFGSLDAFDFPGVGSEGAGSKPKYAQKGSDEYFNLSPAFDMSAQSKFDGNPVVVSSLGERFEQVFGSNFEAMGGSEMGKEILIGDILSGPRARENRIRRTEREKRQRWM